MTIKEPDLADVFRYTNEVRNAYQTQFTQIYFNISEAGIRVLM